MKKKKEKEKEYVVYKHTSPNGKCYIGITSKKPEYRWNNGKGYVGNKYFSNAIQKYGWNNIKHEILIKNLTKEQAEQMEIELIAKYKSNQREFGYNIDSGGNCVGKMSEETKRKLSEAKKGRFCGENSPFYGIPKTEKHKQKMRENHADFSKGNHPQAKRVVLDGIIFGCVEDCADYSGEKRNTMANWLNGHDYMPKEYYDRGLRFIDKQMSDYKIQTGKSRGNNSQAKKVFYNNFIFLCIGDCADYCKKNYSTIRAWIQGKNKMPKEFQNLGLRYATEEDIKKYPIYKNIKQGT